MLVGASCPGWDPPSMAYRVLPIAVTASPCRGSARLGRMDQALLVRLYARTVLNTVPTLSPPTTISWPPTIATPQSVTGLGADGSWVHWPVFGSKRCTAAVLAADLQLAPADDVHVLPVRRGRQVIARNRQGRGVVPAGAVEDLGGRDILGGSAAGGRSARRPRRSCSPPPPPRRRHAHDAAPGPSTQQSFGLVQAQHAGGGDPGHLAALQLQAADHPHRVLVRHHHGVMQRDRQIRARAPHAGRRVVELRLGRGAVRAGQTAGHPDPAILIHRRAHFQRRVLRITRQMPARGGLRDRSRLGRALGLGAGGEMWHAIPHRCLVGLRHRLVRSHQVRAVSITVSAGQCRLSGPKLLHRMVDCSEQGVKLVALSIGGRM